MNKNTGLIESKYIKKMPPQKQLSVTQEYTETLKEILHDAKFKNY